VLFNTASLLMLAVLKSMPESKGKDVEYRLKIARTSMQILLFVTLMAVDFLVLVLFRKFSDRQHKAATEQV